MNSNNEVFAVYKNTRMACASFCEEVNVHPLLRKKNYSNEYKSQVIDTGAIDENSTVSSVANIIANFLQNSEFRKNQNSSEFISKELEDCKEKIKNLEAENEKLKDECNTLKKERDLLKHECNELYDKNETHIKFAEELDKKLKTIYETNENMARTFIGYVTAIKPVLTVEQSQLNSDPSKKRKRADGDRSETAYNCNQVPNFQKLTDPQPVEGQLTFENSEYNKLMEKFTVETEAQKAKIIKLENQMQVMYEEATNKMRSLQVQKENLLKANGELNAKCNRLENSVAQLCKTQIVLRGALMNVCVHTKNILDNT